MKTQSAFSNFKKFLLIFLFFLILFFANFFWGEKIKNSIFKALSPLQSFLWQKFHFLYFLPQKISEIRNLEKENQNLKKENLELKSEIERLKEEKKECDFLKSDRTNTFQNFEYLIAKIVTKTTDSDSFLINKGKNEGVFEGQIVLGKEKVLFGKIEKVYENFSKLRLISSKNFKLLVRKEDSEKDLLLEGRGNLELILNFVPKEINLEPGQKIFTSPSQTDFPAQILVGEIKEVIKKETLPYYQAKIKPYFLNFDFVYLIKNFKPWAEK
jgi:rod shape-determining protein MreC